VTVTGDGGAVLAFIGAATVDPQLAVGDNVGDPLGDGGFGSGGSLGAPPVVEGALHLSQPAYGAVAGIGMLGSGKAAQPSAVGEGDSSAPTTIGFEPDRPFAAAALLSASTHQLLLNGPVPATGLGRCGV